MVLNSSHLGPPCHTMITHTSDSHQIPSQNKRKSKLQIGKNLNFKILQSTLHATHLKLPDKMQKYEMDPTRTVGATEQTRVRDRRTDGQMDGQRYRWTDGHTDGRADGVNPIYLPTTSFCGGYNNIHYKVWDEITYPFLNFNSCIIEV